MAGPPLNLLQTIKSVKHLLIPCALLLPILPLKGEFTIADSAADFSSEQGDRGWSYGSGYGKSFDTSGWTYTESRWELNKGPGIGLGFLGNYPVVDQNVTSYTQVFSKSVETLTRAWTADRNYGEVSIAARLYFVTIGGDGVVLTVYHNSKELISIPIENDEEPFVWRDVVDVKCTLKAGDSIYFTLSSGSGNDSTNDNCAFIATITSE